MFSLFPNIFRILRENHKGCFYYAPVVVNIWHSSRQSINPTMLCLLPAHRETVNKPTVQSMAFPFPFSLFFFSFSCLHLCVSVCVCFSQQEGTNTENRKSLFVPFTNCTVNVPPREGIANAVG